MDAALKQCFQLHLTKPPGDILVFMPGKPIPVSGFECSCLVQVKRRLRVL